MTQPPSHYSLGQILRALENDLYLVPCLDEKLNPCKRVDRCATVEVWKLIQDTIDELIDNLTLLDLLQMQQEKLHKPSLYLTYLMHHVKAGFNLTHLAG